MHQHTTHAGHEAPITEGRTIRQAKHYDLFAKLATLGSESSIRRDTIHRAALEVGETVLDVGCGTGTLTLLAKEAVGSQGKVYGIDASPEMIEVAQHKATHQNADVDFRLAAIEALPFPDGTFDVVLSSLMYHHLPGDLKGLGLAEIRRVLKPNGRVLIVDMKRPTTFMQHLLLVLTTHRAMSSGVYELRPLLEAAGLVNIEIGTMQWKPLGFISGNCPA